MGWNMGCRGYKKYGAGYGVMSCIKYGVIYGALLAKDPSIYLEKYGVKDGVELCIDCGAKYGVP